MASTRIIRYIRAPREKVYQALLDPEAVIQWKVPSGMRLKIHEFENRVGGRIRISLTYDAPGEQGKSSWNTDTYHGYFAELVPNEKIVEIDEFETSDPALQGKMTITIELRDKDKGTELSATHYQLPPGVSSEDNELGWNLALDKLTTLLENK